MSRSLPYWRDVTSRERGCTILPNRHKNVWSVDCGYCCKCDCLIDRAVAVTGTKVVASAGFRDFYNRIYAPRRSFKRNRQDVLRRSEWPMYISVTFFPRGFCEMHCVGPLQANETQPADRRQFGLVLVLLQAVFTGMECYAYGEECPWRRYHRVQQ